MEDSSMKRAFFLFALALCLGLVVVGCRSKGVTSSSDSSDLERQAFINQHILFDFDRYNIRSDMVPVIDSKAAYLNQNTSARVELQGYCDERGTEAYNNALADRRAKSAYNYLVERGGISSSRLVTVSYGEEFPIDPGHNEVAWAKNRRVQTVLQ
jgi:peptidoglycan-associated lipoprotein